MLAYRRRTALLEWLARDGSVTVAQAADCLRVSKVTIRGDLRALEHQGRIRRVRGGAVLAHSATDRLPPEPSDGAAYRRQLAQRAAVMVEDGESIAITAGRVGIDMAHDLLSRRGLKVVTNSIEVAGILAREPTNTVIIVGGMVRPSGAIAMDGSAHDAVANLRVTRAFIAASHLSSAFGVMVESLDAVATLRAIAAVAEARVVVLDGDGGTEGALVGVIPLDGIAHVVLDDRVPLRLIDELHTAGITVSRCGSAVVTVPPLHDDRRPYKIAFANLSETEVFTAEVRRSIEAAALRAGNVELLLADNNYDGETALRNVEQFIAQGADLVIEYQTDDSFAYRLMHRLRLAHIPVIAIDIPLPGATYFGVDNYTAGRIGGQAIADEVARRWNGRLDYVIALALPRSGPTPAARIQGQIDTIREAVDIAPDRIVWLDSENVFETAYRRTCELLERIQVGQQIAVAPVNDAVARGAIAALDATGHTANAIVVSQGADRLALEEMQRPGSALIGAVAFSPESYGERVIPLALEILAGKDVPPALYQHHWLIRTDEAVHYLHDHRHDGSAPHQREHDGPTVAVSV